MGRTVISLCLAVLFALPGLSKGKIAEDFGPACRELDSLLTERTGVEGELCLKSVMKRGRVLDFYFSVSLSDFPWRYDDYIWFCRELKSRFPEEYADYALGRISSRGEPLENLVAGEPGFSGEPDRDAYRIRKSGKRPRTIVEKIGGQAFPEGLDGRHIALWQSHGLYYEQSEGRWEWQRPCLFQTVEDLFTQGYVLPFLVPMLENAGAYVILPRERDVQTHEIIIDNDPGFDDRASGSARLRLSGEYAENGKTRMYFWQFADGDDAVMTLTQRTEDRAAWYGLLIGIFALATVIVSAVAIAKRKGDKNERTKDSNE